jgi:hypothetical protein
MVVVGGDLHAGERNDPVAPAFVNQGHLQLRNVRLSGFRTSVGRTPAPGTAINAHFAADAKLPGCDAPLPFPVREIPDWSPPSSTRWVSIAEFGAIPDDGRDDTEAVNRALSSSGENIVFPYGRYEVSGPLRIPARVKRVLGLHAELRIRGRAASPAIEVNDGSEPIALERLNITSGEGHDPRVTLIAHAAPRRLILRDISTDLAESVVVDRKETGGEVFIEDICCGRVIAAGRQPISARQLNTEGPTTRIMLNGTPLSVLGLKTEFAATIIDARGGADVEVLGGLLYPVRPVPATLPAFRVSDGRMLLSYGESGYAPGMNYVVHVEQTAGSPERVLAERFPSRLMGRMVDCFHTSDTR